MPLTSAFKSDNIQAVRVPAELAYENVNVASTITRDSDVIGIAPTRPMVAQLRAMPKPSSIEIYEPIELPDRELE